ncbi:hypothetical protein [Eubacterium sp.]|uniref:hypothetical protein n=1 Tax=Eubacterium sp. TaxID=142586 RepID=UPI0025CBEA8C|nr:hypothetical protein [Eubacterium sp.]MCR5629923.1 hypothetical protein [Eubacterium sp.]
MQISGVRMKRAGDLKTGDKFLYKNKLYRVDDELINSKYVDNVIRAIDLKDYYVTYVSKDALVTPVDKESD